MTTKSSTRRKRAAARQSHPSAIRTAKPRVKRTEDDVRRAVDRSIEVLRYRYSRDTQEKVVIAWALLRALNTMRPDVATGALKWEYVGKHPDLMMVTAIFAVRFDRKVCGDDGVALGWIGCAQRPDVVRELHRIWSPFTERVEFDFLGEVVMALRHQ